MQPDQKEIIEVLPLNMKQNIEIQNFEMLKIPIKLWFLKYCEINKW